MNTKRIILIFLAILGLGTTWLSLQTKTVTETAPTYKVSLTTDSQRETFRKNMLDTFTKAGQTSTKRAEKHSLDQSGTYAKMFEQNLASPETTAVIHFEPKIVNGGLSEDGQTFTMVVNNGSSQENTRSDYLVSGQVDANGKPMKVEVTKL